MGRPATRHEERKSQIVEAALEEFAQKGYDGTSNRLIAKTAGLHSAALIYHYFPSKEDLFKACLERISALDELRQELERGQTELPEIYLRRAGLAYLNALRAERSSRLVLMVLSATQSHPELVPIVMGRMTEAVIFPLLKYFTQQMAAGRLQAISPISAAQQFMGPMLLRAIASSVLGNNLQFAMPSDEAFIDSHLKVFLDGLRT